MVSSSKSEEQAKELVEKLKDAKLDVRIEIIYQVTVLGDDYEKALAIARERRAR